MQVKQLKKPMRLGVLGAGAIVREVHLPALSLLPEIETVIVVDPSESSLAKIRDIGFQGQLKVMCADKFLSDSVLLSSLGLDAVLIATPNWLHQPLTLRALKLGLHVLCEKPLTLTEAGCLEIAKAAKTAGKIVGVNMARRFYTSATVLKEALDSALVGKLRAVTIEEGSPYGWNTESGAAFDPKGGGILAALGVHGLDLLVSLLGNLKPLSYQDDWAGGCEANSEFQLETEKGIPVSLKISYEKRLKNQIRFIGSEGVLETAIWQSADCHWKPKGWDKLSTVLKSDSVFENPKWPEDNAPFAQMWWEFREATLGGTFRCGAQEAARVLRLVEWGYKNRSPRQSPSSLTRPTLPASNVAVTGGTGFVGKHLVERLHSMQGPKISLLVNRFASCVGVARFPVSLSGVDLLEFESVKKALQGQRFVIHMAYGSRGTPSQQERVTVEGTKNVVEAAIEAGAEAVVVVSTMDVFGHPPKKHADETSAYDSSGSDYRRQKAKAERWALERAKTSLKTRIIVLNPGCIYGPNGEAFVKLPVNLARTGKFCWVENGRGIVNFTYVDNFVDAIVLAATSKKGSGKRFIITDGSASWRDFIEPFLGSMAIHIQSYDVAYLNSLNPRVRYAGFKELLLAVLRSPGIHEVLGRMRFIGALRQKLLDRIPSLKNIKVKPVKLVSLPKESVPAPSAFLADFMGPFQTVFSSKQAQEVLGWKPEVTLAEGQARTIEWLKSGGVDGENVWETTERKKKAA